MKRKEMYHLARHELFAIVAELLTTTTPLLEISRRRGVARATVSGVYRDCVTAGVPVLARHRGRPTKGYVVAQEIAQGMGMNDKDFLSGLVTAFAAFKNEPTK